MNPKTSKQWSVGGLQQWYQHIAHRPIDFLMWGATIFCFHQHVGVIGLIIPFGTNNKQQIGDP